MLDEEGSVPDGLASLHARIAPHFSRAESRRHALAYLAGLLAPIERKTGRQLAQHAGDGTPDGMQRFLSGASWDADRVRDDMRTYAIESLVSDQAVLLATETGFRKQGVKSVGALRQLNPGTGRVELCQVGIFLAYASPRGCALIDRELYLPETWATNETWRTAAGVPAAVTYATKTQLMQRMLARALAARVPAAWVTGTATFGGDLRLRAWLEGEARSYVLAMPGDEEVQLGDEPDAPLMHANEAPPMVASQRWQLFSAGSDPAVPRWAEWVRTRLAAAAPDGWEYWLVLRRSVERHTDLAYYRAFAPAGTTLADMVRAAWQEQAVDACFDRGRRSVGLDQYEVRHWQGWYRHITLAMLAQAYLVASEQP